MMKDGPAGVREQKMAALSPVRPAAGAARFLF